MKDILKKDNRHLFFNTLLCTLLILSCFFKVQSFTITKFDDRVIGSMVLNNFNTTGLIKFLYFALFLVFPILFFISFKVIKKMYKDSTIDICKFNKRLSMFGLISYCFGFFNFLTTRELFSSFFVAIIFFSITILNLILYKSYKKKEKGKGYEYHKLFEWSVLISIPTAIVFSLFIHKIHLFNFSNYILFIFIYLCSIIGAFWFCRKLDFNKLSKSSIIFLMSIIVHPLYLELYNILNQYNVIIPHKSIVLIFLYFILFILSVLYYKKIKEDKEFNYKKYFFVIIIIGLSLLYSANGLVNVIDTEFFESSNHGLGIYELLKYNKIPIIENFDAHMISNEVLGILYGILNHDAMGAIFNIYNNYNFVLLCIIIYFIIKAFVGKDYAFLSVLVIPFIKDASLYKLNMVFGLVPIYFFLNAVNKKNFKSFLWFWLSLACICVWRLDVGFSISVSCVVLLIYLLILNNKKYNIKSIIMSFLSVVLSFLLLYILLCIIKDINPVTRLIELLKISLSNDNWALPSIGSPNTYSYYLYYYVVPILTIMSLLYLLVSKYRKYDNQSLILIILALFYIFNFQRGLVRHSLFENNLMILSYTIFYFSFYIYYIRKSSKITPVVIYSILLVTSLFTINPTFDDYSSNSLNSHPLATKFLNRELSYVLEDEVSDVKVDRVVLSDKMKTEYRDLDKVLSLLLKKDETYLDFSNQTLLYALMGYEKPIYVNQSPGLLSGERTQQMFIDEIKNFKGGVPLAIKAKGKNLSNELDGVPNDFRYYLISEYIYNNYILLANVNDYEIWVKRNYYEDAKEILNKNNIRHVKIYKNTDMKYNKKIKLSYIPYIWGKENINTKVIEKLNVDRSNDKFDIDIKKDNINKAKGNYLILNIDNPSKTLNVTLNVMSKNRIVDKIKFKVVKDSNKYKIRISSLYSWYFNDVDGFELDCNSKLKIDDAYISYGDTLKK